MARGMHKGPKFNYDTRKTTLEARQREFDDKDSGKQGFKRPGSNKK